MIERNNLFGFILVYTPVTMTGDFILKCAPIGNIEGTFNDD